MSQSTKSSWLANSKRISLEAEALEKKTMSGAKLDDLKHESLDLSKLRNESKADTIKRVYGIRLILSDIQNKIKNNTWSNSIALKNQLETFESKLSSFKMIMRSQYDALDDTATIIEKDLNKLVSDMDNWDQPSNDMDLSSLPDPDTQKRISERNKIDLERRAFVGAIDRKIANLGRDGGWDPRDHDTFVRVWLAAFDNSEYFEEQLAQIRERVEDLRLRALEQEERDEDKHADTRVRGEAGGNQDNGWDSDGDCTGDNDCNNKETTRNKGDRRKGGGGNHREGVEEDSTAVNKAVPLDAAVEGELEIPSNKRSAIIKKMLSAVPWKSAEEVDAHIAWYLVYTQLTLIKKKAINEWKQEQLGAKRQLQHNILESEVRRPGEAGVADGMSTTSSQDGDSKRMLAGSGEKDRTAAKERIARWRAAQAKKLEEDKEEQAKAAAAEARRADEERRRKQATLRQQLSKWKEAEELNKELVGEADARLQRPKSVDPAALRRRQARDLETAKTRSERVEQANQKKTQREKTIMEAAVSVTGVGAERDPQRLLSGTKASELNKLSYEALDAAERRRSTAGAHGGSVAMSGRDLQYAGRATPQWMKSVRGGY